MLKVYKYWDVPACLAEAKTNTYLNDQNVATLVWADWENITTGLTETLRTNLGTACETDKTELENVINGVSDNAKCKA